MKKIIISLLTGIGMLRFGANVIMADAPANSSTNQGGTATVTEITGTNCNHIDSDGDGICDYCQANCGNSQENYQCKHHDENGDGICDNCNESCLHYGNTGTTTSSTSYGHHENGHHARHHGNHH